MNVPISKETACLTEASITKLNNIKRQAKKSNINEENQIEGKRQRVMEKTKVVKSIASKPRADIKKVSLAISPMNGEGLDAQLNHHDVNRVDDDTHKNSDIVQAPAPSVKLFLPITSQSQHERSSCQQPIGHEFDHIKERHVLSTSSAAIQQSHKDPTISLLKNNDSNSLQFGRMENDLDASTLNSHDGKLFGISLDKVKLPTNYADIANSTPRQVDQSSNIFGITLRTPQPSSNDANDLDASTSHDGKLFGISLDKVKLPTNCDAISKSTPRQVDQSSSIFGIALRTPQPSSNDADYTLKDVTLKESLENEDANPWGTINLRKVEPQELLKVVDAGPKMNDSPNLSTPWPVKLKKVNDSGTNAGSVNTPLAAHGREDRTNDDESLSKIQSQQLVDEDQILISRTFHDPAEESVIKGETIDSRKVSNDYSEKIELTTKENEKVCARNCDLKQGDTIDLGKLPASLFPMQSRTKIIPIASIDRTGGQVVILSKELIMIAKERDDNDLNRIANVIWYKYPTQIRSLNMLGNCEAEISTIEGASYPLYFDSFSTCSDFFQTYLNLKNNVLEEVEEACIYAKVSDVETEIERTEMIDPGALKYALYNDEEKKIIDQYRRMLQEPCVTKEAIELRLKNRGIPDPVMKAIFDNKIFIPGSRSNALQCSATGTTANAVLNRKPDHENDSDADNMPPPLKDDATYRKYFMMLKIGQSMDVIKHALTRDGLDPSVMDGDHDLPAPDAKPTTAQKNANQVTDSNIRPTSGGIPLKDDPKYEKYLKMLKMGLPLGAVKNAMMRDGLDPSVMDGDHNHSIPGDNTPTAGGIPLKDDPKYEKYFKMLKMGLPLGAVKNAITRDGLDPCVMDGDHNLPIPGDNTPTSKGVPLKNDPKYEKYFKMLKMGLPLGAVKNALTKDGLDPCVMDGDHDVPVPGDNKPSAPNRSKVPQTLRKPAIKDNFKRVRLYWNEADVGEGNISDSIWGGDNDMENIIDSEEIKEFVQREKAENANPASRIVAANAQQGKERVEVIERKRAYNCDILLKTIARSMTHESITAAVDKIDVTALYPEQLAIVEQIMPSKTEAEALAQYLTGGKVTDLCESEQFMVKMTSIEQRTEKIEALRFLLAYPQLLAELQKNLSIISNACNELKSSQRFKRILKAVLEFGNEINTAGPTGRGKASAITLSSLSKLGETKDIDKNIPLLQIFVRQILKRKEDLASFEDDIPSVCEAVRVEWQSMVDGEYKEICKRVAPLSKLEHLEPIHTFCVKEGLHARGSFLSDLKGSIDFTKCQFDQLTRDYFLEKGEQIPHQWFANIDKFTKSFKNAKKEVIRQLAVAEKKAGRMKAKAIQKNGSNEVASTGNNTIATGSRNGGMNELTAILENRRNQNLSTTTTIPTTPIPTISTVPDGGILELTALLQKRRNRILTTATSVSTAPIPDGESNELKEHLEKRINLES